MRFLSGRQLCGAALLLLQAQPALSDLSVVATSDGRLSP